MKTLIDKNGNLLKAKVEGRLDAVTSEEFLEKVEQEMDAEVSIVEIDCALLEYISSAGLRVLMALSNAMDQREDGVVRLLHVGEQVGDVLRITGMNELFQIQ